MLRELDLALLRLLRTRGHAAPLEWAATRLSALGEHGGGWLAVTLAGAALDRARRDRWRRAARVTVAAYAANQLVKAAVRRPRPRLEGLPPLAGTLSDRSYPSAHASTSFASARALSGLLPAAPLNAVAVLMAVSRVYLGVHHPSDVAAGAVLGAAVERLVP